MTLPEPFLQSDLPLPVAYRGKVRDVYRLSAGRWLMITTDRLSAFDRVLGGVPYKGQVLNQLTAWWYERLADVVPTPLLAVPDPNAMVVRQLHPLPVEVIVRGYITGSTSTSLWTLYAAGERVIYGYHLPEGLHKNQPLPQPLITPTTKAAPGAHDERLTPEEVVSRGYVAADLWEKVQQVALTLFARGQQIARQAGLILVDTKYEFGLDEHGQLYLMDEVHTPDSSRFWLADTYAARLAQGLEPEHLDKEMVRLALREHGYRGDGDPPTLPPAFWAEVSARYVALYERLTGRTFLPGAYPVAQRLREALQQQGWLGASEEVQP